ncbi:toxin-activating lysine-acyltransferase [Pseudomonas sp. HY7a-MNA-CIBAN-0227]|uniref:toxin-activating lysine-acyltransferase n=1 Tax=Pseudomonas sp. HY7a-MNA-CIBAN-0227 TaxID=3140474 RepID=UPI0033341273
MNFERSASVLGSVCSIIFNCKKYSLLHAIVLKHWIVPAIEHDQIRVYFDKFSNPVGYITWAHLARDTELRLLNDLDFSLHLSEWNEGGRTWILDFCFPTGMAKFSIAQLKKDLTGQGIKQVFWVRRDADYSVRKVSSSPAAATSILLPLPGHL